MDDIFAAYGLKTLNVKMDKIGSDNWDLSMRLERIYTMSIHTNLRKMWHTDWHTVKLTLNMNYQHTDDTIFEKKKGKL